jgi:hypothetical protein
MRSDEDQGGSDRQCHLIQLFRHQIQRLTARPAPAEPDHYVASLECLEKETIFYPATACHARPLPFLDIVISKGRQVQGC